MFFECRYFSAADKSNATFKRITKSSSLFLTSSFDSNTPNFSNVYPMPSLFRWVPYFVNLFAQGVEQSIENQEAFSRFSRFIKLITPPSGNARTLIMLG